MKRQNLAHSSLPFLCTAYSRLLFHHDTTGGGVHQPLCQKCEKLQELFGDGTIVPSNRSVFVTFPRMREVGRLGMPCGGYAPSRPARAGVGGGETARVMWGRSSCVEWTQVPYVEPRKSADNSARARTKLSVENSAPSPRSYGRPALTPVSPRSPRSMCVRRAAGFRANLSRRSASCSPSWTRRSSFKAKPRTILSSRAARSSVALRKMASVRPRLGA